MIQIVSSSSINKAGFIMSENQNNPETKPNFMQTKKKRHLKIPFSTKARDKSLESLLQKLPKEDQQKHEFIW